MSQRLAQGGGRRERETYARKLEDFGGEILENSSNVDGCLGADAHLVLAVVLQESLDTTAGELGGGKPLAWCVLGSDQAAVCVQKLCARGFCGTVDNAAQPRTRPLSHRGAAPKTIRNVVETARA